MAPPQKHAKLHGVAVALGEYEAALAVKSTARYLSDLRANARGLWAGEMDFFIFFESMQSSISRGFTKAWAEGAAKCGIGPDELSAKERKQLRVEMQKDSRYVSGLADWISENSRANGGLLRDVYFRLGMWANRYVAVQSLAMSMACGDQKLEWVLSSAKKVHCKSCLRLDGIVKRASVWRAARIEPRMRRLVCKGYRCGCKFRPTTKRGTPGPLPRI